MTNAHGLARWRPRAALIGLAAALIGVSAWHTATAQPSASQGPLRIAVVDLGKLGDGLQEAADMTDRLKAMGEASQVKLDEVASQLERATKDLQNFREKTAEYWQKAGEAMELEVQARARKQMLERAYDQQRAMVTTEMYGRMIEGINQLAQAEGYDLVLVDDRSTLPPKGAGAEAVGQAIQARQVLFASPRVDITDQLIVVMNNRYKAGRRNGTGPAPAAPAPIPSPTTPPDGR